jgi:hypothetical protein
MKIGRFGLNMNGALPRIFLQMQRVNAKRPQCGRSGGQN